MLYLIFFNFSIVTKKTQISQLGISVVVSVVHSLSQVQPCATPWTAAHQVPLSMEFSRQEYWNGLPFPSPGNLSNPGIKPRSAAL